MAGFHKLRDLYRLLIRLERIRKKYSSPDLVTFFDTCVMCIQIVIDITETRVPSKTLTLEKREQLVELYQKGLTNREISSQLDISDVTVNKYRRKAGLFKNRGQLNLPLNGDKP